MLALALIVAFAVAVSFICSLTEAALYALSWSAIERMRRAGRKAGEMLHTLRGNIDKPIAAILTLNTAANTIGAAVAGAAFVGLFGDAHMPLFALAFTLLVLCLGEIVPKTLGVAYSEALAPFLARPLVVMVKILSPVLWLSGRLTKLIAPPASGPSISEDDIRAFTSLSRQAGQIKAYEERFIRNVLALDQKRVREIMTPRTVVFSLPDEATVAEAYNDPRIWHFSRIPVYGEDNEDLLGVVERPTLARCFSGGKTAARLSEIMHPIHFILETQTLNVLLDSLLKAKGHLFAVLDEYGGLAGVVSLEDVLEEILGREIMDESDRVADMRALARERRKALAAGGRETAD
ncbi:MAG: hemolysin family protein [Desulfovibrio sp.]|jgi:CBS domain containing-hemolysin-like protein|nr:hemolysin family protein [Desulfovibrio sp.]